MRAWRKGEFRSIADFAHDDVAGSVIAIGYALFQPVGQAQDDLPHRLFQLAVFRFQCGDLLADLFDRRLARLGFILFALTDQRADLFACRIAFCAQIIQRGQSPSHLADQRLQLGDIEGLIATPFEHRLHGLGVFLNQFEIKHDGAAIAGDYDAARNSSFRRRKRAQLATICWRTCSAASPRSRTRNWTRYSRVCVT